MDGCFKILMDEIHQYAGTINQLTGDGVMALFGAPLSHEDHAQRACYGALSIQRVLALEDHARQACRAALSIQKVGVLGSGHANVLIVQP